MTEQALTTTTGTFLPAHIAQSARKYAQASKRDNTRTTYDKAWGAFVEFCTANNYTTLLDESSYVDIVTAVIHYLTDLADTGYKLSTIELHKSAISSNYGGRSNPTNPALSAEVRILLQGITNKLGDDSPAQVMPEQARPITRDELRNMASVAGEGIGGIRDRAILLVGWFGALRRSEIAGLDARDLIFRADSVVITLRKTKTDKTGKGQTLTLPRLIDTTIDPVSALQAWLDVSGTGSGPVFVRVDKWGHAGHTRINDKHIDSVVKRMALRAGLQDTPSDYRRISGHSLRAGFATQAAHDGITDHAIMAVTRHTSRSTLDRYIREGGAKMLETIRRVAGESVNDK